MCWFRKSNFRVVTINSFALACITWPRHWLIDWLVFVFLQQHTSVFYSLGSLSSVVHGVLCCLKKNNPTNTLGYSWKTLCDRVIFLLVLPPYFVLTVQGFFFFLLFLHAYIWTVVPVFVSLTEKTALPSSCSMDWWCWPRSCHGRDASSAGDHLSCATPAS